MSIAQEQPGYSKSMASRARIILTVFLAFVLLVAAGVALAAHAFLKLPDFESMRSSVEIPIRLASGEKAMRRVGPKAPGWVPIQSVSNNLLMAVIASEDTSFRSHKGVDFHELKESIKKDWQEKRWARGASTLTQQVIKNVFLSPEKSVIRKAKEVLWAGKMEEALTKNEILCFYVNMAEWGPGIYGIGAASKYYFDLPPSALSARQSAFLAMLLPAPVKYHSYFKKRALTPWASARVNQILRVMNRMGFIDDSTFEEARRESLWGEVPDILDPDSQPNTNEDTTIPDATVPTKPSRPKSTDAPMWEDPPLQVEPAVPQDVPVTPEPGEGDEEL